MVHGEHFLSIHGADFPVHFSDSLPGEEAGHGMPAEGDDQFRGKEVYLLLQPGTALFHFLWEGVPVPWRTAFYYVGYVDFFSCQIDGSEQLFQELAGGADEGSALLVFVEAGTLADEHDSRAFGAFSGHDVSAALAKTTGSATVNPFMQKVKLQKSYPLSHGGYAPTGVRAPGTTGVSGPGNEALAFIELQKRYKTE